MNIRLSIGFRSCSLPPEQRKPRGFAADNYLRFAFSLPGNNPFIPFQKGRQGDGAFCLWGDEGFVGASSPEEALSMETSVSIFPSLLNHS